MSQAACLGRLRWKCRRGMLELDMLLEEFCSTHLERLPEEELTTFDYLLDTPDPELYSWMIGQAVSSNLQFQAFIDLYFKSK